MLQPSIEDLLHLCRNASHVSHLHACICQVGLEAYPSLGNQLIQSLAGAGNFSLAQQVFDKLLYYNDHSWDTLLIGCVRCGECERAQNIHVKMQENNYLHPSAHVVVSLLKACAVLQDFEWGCKLHSVIIENGLLEKNNFVGSALVHMFAKCGVLAEAQAIFDKLPLKDVVLWNALIGGYVNQGHEQTAIQCFEQMRLAGVLFNFVTLVSCLTACGSIGDGMKGQELHGEALKRGFETESAVGNSLVDMYSKCGWIITAKKVFDNLLVRDVVSWNVLITGYVELSHDENALHALELLQQEGISLDDVTFLCGLKACANVGIIRKGWEIHAMLVKVGLEKQLLIGNTLVDMYSKCGLLAAAEKVFCMSSRKDVTLWNVLLTAYADYERADDALYCFDEMQQNGIPPNSVTFICILKCCGCIEAASIGLKIYVAVVKQGLEKELHVGSALVDMFCKCKLLLDAWRTLDELPIRTEVSWNAMIAGYAKQGYGEEALHCLELMQNDSISPSAVTFVCVLKACCNIQAAKKHQEIHAQIAKKGLEREISIGNSLVGVYLTCGLLAESLHIFDRLLVQDAVSWSSLIAGLTEQGANEVALFYLDEMQHERICLNPAIYVCSLKACRSTGATSKGQNLHIEIVKQGLERGSLVGNVLVDVYANGGWLLEAQELFDRLPSREVVSWNALIAGYAQLGESEKAIDVLDRMLEGGLKPNHVTFLSVLYACSHAGLVDKGQLCFKAIFNDYGIQPTLKHYTCVVDVLSRAGFLNKALALIEIFPFHPDVTVWLIVLGASRKWANVKVGRHAFQQVVQLNVQETAAYTCMGNIYRDAAMQKEATTIDELRFESQGWKHSGYSWSLSFNDFIMVE